jgi:prephenate dehydratase
MKLTKAFFGIFGVCALMALAARASSAAEANPGGVANGATITFRKVFKSSYPEFVEIKVNDSGSGTYDIRQLDEEPNPHPLAVGSGLAQRIFQLAATLHNFQGQNLDVHRRIANLGQKTLKYDKGSESYEVTFNYTLNDSATQLLDIFEGIAREESDLADLQRTMKYDRLGVNDILMQVEGDYSKKLLPEPERLLPTLDQIASDEKIIDIARDRARSLASHIRGGH